jgi:hypothetical protein
MRVKREPSVRDIPQIIANLRGALASGPTPPPIHCAFGTAMALRVIMHRGTLAPGDMETLRAATALLDRAHRTGVL